MFVSLVLTLVLLVVLLINSVRKPHNFPPGPPWLPIIGSIPRVRELSKKLGGQHLALLELAKEFKTNVLGLKLGKNTVITVFSPQTIKEVLTGEEYEGRPDSFFIRLRCYGEKRGITCTDGEFWMVQRRFVVRHLRSLGFGKKVMETKIKEELCDIIETINRRGEKLNIGRILSQAVINVLWSLTAGTHIPREDHRCNKLLDLLAKRNKVFNMSGGILNQHPWLRFIAPEKTGYNLIKQLNAELREFFMETINEHHRTWTEGRNDDLIYSFISEMKQATGYSKTFTHEQLLVVCLDLFIAGSHTSSNTINFAILVMLLHLDIQSKVQTVLDEAFNGNGKVHYIDRYKVPYIEAVLSEIQRVYGVAPIVGPRRVTRDTILDGYFIPKDMEVLIHSYALHMNKEIWGDPEVFRPERFLDSEGKLILNDSLIPFGLGKRRCLGESLARNCIFIFFSEILRKYKIRPVEGMPLPTLKPLPGILLSPEKYFAQFIPRHVPQ